MLLLGFALGLGAAARGQGGAYALGGPSEAEALILRERALIAEDPNGTTLIVEADLAGPPGDVAWVFPLPASPTRIVADQARSESLFRQLDRLARPARADRRDPLFGARFIVLGMATLLALAAPFRLRALAPSRRLRRFGLETAAVLAIGFGGLYFTEQGMPTPPIESDEPLAAAFENVPQPLDEGRRGAALVQAGPELDAWLKKHGVAAGTRGVGVADGMRCAVMRRVIGVSGHQTTGLVAFRFAQRDLRFAFGDGRTPPTDLELNVIGDSRATVEGLRELACAEVARPLASPLPNDALAGWLTRSRGPAPTGTVRLAWSPPRAFRTTIFDRPNRNEALALGGGVLMLATAWAAAIFVIVRGMSGRRATMIQVRAMVLVAGVCLVLFPMFAVARSGSGRVRSTWPSVSYELVGSRARTSPTDLPVPTASLP